MKVEKMPRRMFVALLATATVLAGGTQPFNVALAQDGAFLACGELSDRGQRIACLEDALEAAQDGGIATPAQPAVPARPDPAVVVSPAPAPAPAVPPQAPASATAPIAAEAPAIVTAPENDPSLLERLRNFGQRDTATVSTDEEGQDQLHDTITKLEKRNNLWVVTLSSGQVWMQQLPRTLNLREGDEISIYQAGIGNGYRLATPRLSGFIRVERVK